MVLPATTAAFTDEAAQQAVAPTPTETPVQEEPPKTEKHFSVQGDPGR